MKARSRKVKNNFKRSRKSALTNVYKLALVMGIFAAIFITLYFSLRKPETQTVTTRAESNRAQASNTEYITYQGNNPDELQTMIDGYKDKNLVIELTQDLIAGQGSSRKVTTPRRKGINSESADSKVMLYFENTGIRSIRSTRSITIKSANRVTINTEQPYGIFAKNVNLTLSNLNFQKGKSTNDMHDGEERAFIWIDKGTLTMSDITIEGDKDIVSDAHVIKGGKITDATVKKGIVGVYSLNSKVTITGVNFTKLSWDAITLNGSSNALIKDTTITGTHPEVFAGAGIAFTQDGVNPNGSMTIDNVTIRERFKSILVIGRNAVIIRNSRIELHSEEGYGIEIGEGSIDMRNTIVSGGSNLLDIPLDFPVKKNVSGNTFKYDRRPEERSLPREKFHWFEELPAIEVPSQILEKQTATSLPRFNNNKILIPNGVNLDDVLPKTIFDRDELLRNGNNTVEFYD